MRRPRSKLEVSTFPFLAVLLCVMGSLMLLLFIMDRRAKIAAKFRVAEELEARQSRTKAEEDARQAEWDKAREQLHRSLQQQHDQLRVESAGFQSTVGEAGNKLAASVARQAALQEQVKGETAKIGALVLDIEAQRSGLQQANKQETMSKADLIEAARELAELERAFLQLRSLKEREKQVHSVVPYRGKRGDERSPIYVECVKDGVVFHPDKTPLQGFEFNPPGVRSEIGRRFGPLTVRKSAKDKETGQGPYVLFLIRPAGIASYYKAQAALKGYELDFGYELIDEGWVLDFSTESHAKNSASSRPQLAWKHSDDIAPAPSGNKGKGPNIGGPPLIAKGPASGSTGGAPGAGNSGGPILPLPGGMNQGGPLSPSPGNRLLPPQAPTAGGAGSPRVDTGIPVRPPSFVPIAKGTSTPMGGNGGPGVGSINTPIPGNNVGTPTSGSPKEPTGSPGEGNVKPTPSFGSGQGKPAPAAPPLSKLLGNKDFVITIECRQDAVTIDPSGLIYRWTTSNAQATDAALVQTVTNLIARRQASVRPGEPPYRPQIRFRVTPDGLRTYLHVYPLLEQLRVPWTRENVEE